MSRTKQVLLSVAGTVAALVVATVSYQVFYEPKPVLAGWRSDAIELEKNQLGFRGHPIRYAEDDYVIVLLGDSQVEAKACAYDWMPERRLQHHLEELGKNVAVVTLGAGGYGQDQQLLVLREYLQDHRADLVVLWLTIGNDVWNNVFPTHWPANGMLKPTFWLEGGELRGPSHEMEGEDPKPFLDLVGKIQKELFPRDRDREWEELHLPEAYVPLDHYEGEADDTWQKRWDGLDPQGRYENLDNEKSHFTVRLTPPSPRTLYGLELTRVLIGEIDRLVASRDGRLVAFTTEAAVRGDEARVVQVLNGRYYETSKAQQDAAIELVTEGLELYRVPVTTPNPTVGPLDGHLNQHAVDQVMKDLAAQLAGTIRPR